MGSACSTHIYVWWVIPTGRGLLEDLGVGGKIILKSIIRNIVRGCGQDSSGSGRVQVAVLKGGKGKDSRMTTRLSSRGLMCGVSYFG